MLQINQSTKKAKNNQTGCSVIRNFKTTRGLSSFLDQLSYEARFFQIHFDKFLILPIISTYLKVTFFYSSLISFPPFTCVLQLDIQFISAMPEEKKLNNRFDEYEIASVFTEYAEDFLPKRLKPIRTQFYIKCVLGVLLFINGYLSHWGPWPWPSNYYFLIFSIIFYHVGTYLYGLQSPVKNAEGNTVGFFKLGEKIVAVVVRIGEDKQRYTLEVLEGSTSLGKREIVYYEYFTQSGVFLNFKFRKVLEEWIEQVQKGSK